MSTHENFKTNAIRDCHYDDDFYRSQIDGSLRSAIKYVDFLSKIYCPYSVVDVGCGRGTWLKAFKDNGVQRVVGYDGAWNNKNSMIDQSIDFRGVDLNKPIIVADAERFDLAISLEVAEHLLCFNFHKLAHSIVRCGYVWGCIPSTRWNQPHKRKATYILGEIVCCL